MPGNNPPLNRHAVRQSFNRAARHYDANAHPQRAVARRLLACSTPAIAALPRPPARILDAGAGSGFSTQALAEAFPRSRIVVLDFAQQMLNIARTRSRGDDFVCGNMENLPFTTAGFDLLCCSSALQWSDHPHAVFGEWRRTLKHGALLLLSVYTGDTLAELRNSWRGVDEQQHTLTFPDATNLCRLLEATGFGVSLCHTQNEVVLYDSVATLLKTLKHTGVRNLRRQRAGLTTAAQIKRMSARYQARYQAGPGVMASYAVSFIIACRRRTRDE